MSTVSSSSATVLQRTVTQLQSELTLYSQAVNGSDAQAKSDYQRVQSDITQKNLSQAQTDLSKLKRESESESSSSTTNGGSQSTTPNSTGRYLNSVA